jgi:hypothetical protein
VDGRERLRLVRAVGDLDAGLDGLVATAAGPEALDQLGVGHRDAVAISDASGQVDGLGAEPGHQNRWRLLGERVDPGVLHPVVRPRMAQRLALPEPADQLQRLLEHLEAHLGLGPVITEHVLVQRLATADAELKTALEHHRRGGRRLRDHCGMDAHGRTGHGGGDWHPRRDLREGAEHGPHE